MMEGFLPHGNHRDKSALAVKKIERGADWEGRRPTCMARRKTYLSTVKPQERSSGESTNWGSKRKKLNEPAAKPKAQRIEQTRGVEAPRRVASGREAHFQRGGKRSAQRTHCARSSGKEEAGEEQTETTCSEGLRADATHS